MAKLLQDATKQTRTRKCKTFKCCKMLLEDGEARRRLSCVLLLSCDIPATFLRLSCVLLLSCDLRKKVARKSQLSRKKVAGKSQRSRKKVANRKKAGCSQVARKS